VTADMPIRTLITDDHSVVRQGLRMFLALDPDLEVIGEAGDGAEGLRLARELQPEVGLVFFSGLRASSMTRYPRPSTASRSARGRPGPWWTANRLRRSNRSTMSSRWPRQRWRR
jgi:hypothetical protein